MATAIELNLMPHDDVLRQLLGESTNLAAQDIAGCNDSTILSARKRLDTPPPWDDRTPTFRLAAGVVVRHRWRDYPERVPAPIERSALVKLIEHEMARASRAPGSKPAAPTMTPGECLIHLRRFEQENQRWPTVGELVAFTDRTESQIRDKVARTIRNGQAVWEGHTVRIVERAFAAGEVEDKQWSREQLEAHLLQMGIDPTPRPKVQSQRIQAHFASLAERGESTIMNNPASAVREAERAANNEALSVPGVVEPEPAPAPDPEPESPPDTQPELEPEPEPVHEPTPTEGATIARPSSYNGVNWPPDADFIRLVESEYTTRGAAERLAGSFGCTADSVQYHINLVFDRMNRERPRQEPGREHIYGWGTDEEFAEVTERVYREHPRAPNSVLSELYHAPAKRVADHIIRVFKRLERPRPMATPGRPVKEKPEPPTEPVMIRPKLEVAPMATSPGHSDANQPQKPSEAKPSLTLRQVLNALMVVEMPEDSLKAVLRQLVA